MKILLGLLIIALIAVTGMYSFRFFLADHYLPSGLCTAACLFFISLAISSVKLVKEDEPEVKEQIA
jgi:hypothetical protein